MCKLSKSYYKLPPHVLIICIILILNDHLKIFIVGFENHRETLVK